MHQISDPPTTVNHLGDHQFSTRVNPNKMANTKPCKSWRVQQFSTGEEPL